jgi:ABC-type nitrate/sulfonate/bicarbonate transport system substrate-binding protein
LAANSARAQQVGTASNPLVVATGRFHGFLPAYQLPERLKAEGIAVKIIEFPTATERLEAVAAGYAQMSYAGLTASTVLRARGKDVVIVASTNEKGRALVATPDIKDLKGLIGKKIGVGFASIEHITLVATLRQAGIDPKKDVQMVNIPSPDQPIAFSSKSIDAFMAFEPWATMGVKKFGGKILSYPFNTPVGAIDSGIETSERFIAENPKIVAAVVKAHIAAVKFYQANLDALVQEGVKNYKVPEEIMRESMSNIELTYNIKPDQVKVLAQYLGELGLVKPEEIARIDWARFINTSFLA